MPLRITPFWVFAAFILPATLALGQILFEILAPGQIRAWSHSENGPHETLQAIVLLLAIGVALTTLLRMDRKKDPLLTAWVTLAGFCSLYVCGEEISWGQHIFDWKTPETWSVVNDQNETNLHNISAWLDQKPRAILEIGVIVGGIIIPLLGKFRPAALPKRFAAFYPSLFLLPTALFAEGFKFAQTWCDSFGGCNPFTRVSEVQELFFFLFVFLYLLEIAQRVLPRAQK